MFELEAVGRLALMRWRGAISMDELLRVIGEFRSGTAAARVRIVACSDYRAAESFPVAALDAIVWSLMRQDNPHIECSVFLVDERNVVLCAQLESMFAQSGHQGRKLFTSVPPLVAWLRPKLSPPELQRIETFLGRERSERPPEPSSTG
jgi:hypothetical protein